MLGQKRHGPEIPQKQACTKIFDFTAGLRYVTISSDLFSASAEIAAFTRGGLRRKPGVGVALVELRRESQQASASFRFAKVSRLVGKSQDLGSQNGAVIVLVWVIVWCEV